ncbi:TPA: hypothetical protein MYQ36_003895 [Citrobacter braakii]|nr:hypothetical protein [Citrobacter braakii]
MTTNHPAHGPVSLDRLYQIRDHLQHDTQYSSGGNRAYILADMLNVIDEVLASSNAEPVFFIEVDGDDWIQAGRIPGSTFDFNNLPDGINRLYAAPPAPVIPDEKPMPEASKMHAIDAVAAIAEVRGWNACRAAMLQAGNSTVAPDGYVLVPKKLTAENGAKGVLSGEFSETKFINCPECFGDDDCETCEGSGRIEITVPVTWTTIKAIWAKGVEHLAAAPQQEVKS